MEKVRVLYHRGHWELNAFKLIGFGGVFSFDMFSYPIHPQI
jgi:hypothetical protein